MEKQPFGVLIIHGFTASLDCVSGIDKAINNLGIPTAMPVLRGHGADSPEALRGVAWNDWVDDARAAFNDLSKEADKIIVFGHSMGGLVALTLAAGHAGAVDSVIVAAAAIQLTSPLAPGKPLHFLAPLFARLFRKWKFSPNYADPELAKYDTNYTWAPMDAIVSFLEFSEAARRILPDIHVPALIMQSREDTTVSPESAEIIYNGISTPAKNKHIAWFEKTDHEMFRDCERELAVETIAEYVKERVKLKDDRS